MHGIISSVQPSDVSPSAEESSDIKLLVRFWGVRGAIACPDPQTVRYGGNTACVEVNCGKHTVIFDGGTGLRPLGDALVAATSSVDVDIFYSHFHWDHICGLPFFAPCYASTSRLRLWGSQAGMEQTTEDIFRLIMTNPFFPVGLEGFKARIDFHDFAPGNTLRPLAGVTMRTARLNHPGGSTGYRLEFGNSAIAYITDTEHRPGVLDPNVLALARDADLMIYDGNYTDDEFLKYVGWGHSTWQQGVRLANAAGVRTLAIFHHDPKHHDKFLDVVSAEAEASRPGTIVAAEGLTLRL